jgi:hypothetical protein
MTVSLAVSHQMFILPFLLYTYQQNFSSPLTTTFSQWNSFSLPQWVSPTQWLQNTTLPSLPTNSDMAPYALYYFLSGAMFFLGSAYMVLSVPLVHDYKAVDGIATMSDFTKTNIMKTKNEKPNRELIALVETNGIESEEFLTILSGNRKRSRYFSPTT